MNKKYLIPLAIIAVLPFSAMADWTYNYVDNPAFPEDDATVTVADNDPPYVTIGIDNDDAEHIASTAYVKGAYNDAIAGMNKLNTMLEEKQYRLSNIITGDYVQSDVFDRSVMSEVLHDDNITAQDWQFLETHLISTAGVVSGIKSQRVEIYTTWDDDSDTAEVPLITASQN